MLAPEGRGWISNASLATVKWPCGLHGQEVREATDSPWVSATRSCWEPLLGAEGGGGEQVCLGCSSFLVFPGVAVITFCVCVCTLR